MLTCPRCQTANAPANRFCQQCGRPLEVQAAGDATIRMSGTQVVRGPIQQTVTVASLFAANHGLILDPAADVIPGAADSRSTGPASR